MTCQRCHGPDHGAQLCPSCERQVEQEQNLEDDLEPGRPWAEGFCWLARFSDQPCDKSRMDKAHLIPKQLLKREHVPAEGLWDPRCWVPACRTHHAAFDVARTLRVPRSCLPAGLEVFAAVHGLSWWVEREYGPNLDESEAA